MVTLGRAAIPRRGLNARQEDPNGFKSIVGNRPRVFTTTPLHGQDRAGLGTAPPELTPVPGPSPQGHSLGEGIEPVGLLGLREGDSHARGERGVKHDGSALVAGGQINRGHRADALSI